MSASSRNLSSNSLLCLAIGLAGLAGFTASPLSAQAPATPQTSLVTLNPTLFPLPEELRDNVVFWTLVYAKYDSHHRLLHDERHMGVIYEVINFTDIDSSDLSEGRKRQKRRQRVRAAEAKYRSILIDLHAGRTSKNYPDDQQRVAGLFESVPGKGRAKYSGSSGRLRTQTCLRDRFAEGIQRSGLYMSRIERIFRDRGLPVELSRLPFVESLFQMRAHSSASAVGIWQFVRATARSYLKMEIEYDDRYDPLRASDAAARHLTDNYKSLKTWPLALTAYNHGANGMRRAVRLLGTRDMGQIATRYKSRLFGFASRNFYSEFIAAAQVYANRKHYFPNTEPYPPVQFEVFAVNKYVPIGELAKQASLSIDELRAMNPALVGEVWSDDLYLPAGHEIRVPQGASAGLSSAYEGLKAELKSAHQVGLYYRVRGGDTLARIARKYGTSIRSLQRVNNLRSANIIRVGQTLLIPPTRGSGRARTPTTTTGPAIAGPRPTSHVIRKGETLTQIARRYGVPIESLLAANRLSNADHLRVGQRLTLPTSGQRVHHVRKGETLGKIAERYGTTIQSIKRANRLRGDLIQPGQPLIIP